MIFDDGDEDSGLYYSLVLESKVIRVLETLMIPCNIKIRADISPDIEMHSMAMAKSTLKIKSWVDSILHSSILIASDNNEAAKMLFDDKGAARTGNNIVLTPGNPTDDLLAVLFQAKFNALSEDDETFVMCEVRSDNMLGLRSTFVGLPSDFLPDNAQWIGPRSFFDEPWWNRDDVSTYDLIPAPDADLSVKPDWARPVGTGFDFDPPQPSDKGPRVILRPSFKPKVIDGGKKPDA